MSAWICSKAHIDALVEPSPHGLDSWTPEEIGQMLWQTNYDSVNYRYNESAETPRYEYAKTTQPLVARLKLLDSYEYQSCERDDWKASDAYAYCQQLRGQLIDQLPGYADAPWSLHGE